MVHTLFVARLTLNALGRDRVLHTLLGVSLVLLCLVPAFSLFSMRQVQELAVTLVLSCHALLLIFLAIFLGSSTLWRDLERRHTSLILGLPLSRSHYLLGRFFGVGLFLLLFSLCYALLAVIAVSVSATFYEADRPVIWMNLLAALGGDLLKAWLLAAVAFLFSTFSTSLFLPLFGTLAIYSAGSASQEVYEYLNSDFSSQISAGVRWLAEIFYWILPNLTLFDLKTQAVYSLPLDIPALIYPFIYGFVYTSLVLWGAEFFLSRRDLV